MRPLRRSLALVAFAALTAPGLAAQSAEQEAAYRVITGLFDSMRARDTAAMRAAFEPNASMQSLRPDGVRFETIEGWISGVGRAPAGLVLDERLANEVVHVHANLATIWVDYWFFAGERFSHCGVDSFQLVQRNGTWRIFSVVDTRQTEGCPPAPTGTKAP